MERKCTGTIVTKADFKTAEMLITSLIGNLAKLTPKPKSREIKITAPAANFTDISNTLADCDELKEFELQITRK